MQTQVIPYLRELVKNGYQISLLTFEPDLKTSWDKAQIESQRIALQTEGIDWHILTYHKWPSAPATLFDILNGWRFVVRLNRRAKFDLFHGRGHLGTIVGALAKYTTGAKLLFDIRGFFPEEYTDAGVWPVGGWLYRSAKRVERWLLKEADGFVVLTEKARELLFPESKISGVDKLGRPVEVIPCCIDTKRFLQNRSRDDARKALGVEGRFVIVYVGSLGGWYLTDEMMDFFAAAKDVVHNAFLLIITQRNVGHVSDTLKQRGFDTADFTVKTVTPSQLADELAAGDMALSFIKKCYSKQSSSPTKIGEYLAAGLPIIANTGVGDVDSLLQTHGVGLTITKFDDTEYRAAIVRLREMGDIREICKMTARRELDLNSIGGTRYVRLYKKLLHS